MSAAFEFVFDESFDSLIQMEAEAKGCLAGVKARLADGRVYPVCFYDPVRLAQDLEGESFIAEVGLIVVPEVTLAQMRAAVESLVRTGYFESLRPL